MKFYSHFFKEEFLDTIENKSTRGTFEALFTRSAKLESQLGKDLYSFSQNDLELLLYTFNSAHENTLATYLHQCRVYCDYAIDKGMRQSNINLFKLFPVSKLENYVVSYKLKFFNKTDINEILTQVLNWVDYALFLSLFEGIKGYKNSEICNMTFDDLVKARNTEVERNGRRYYTIELHSDVANSTEIKTRELEISEELFNALNKAYAQEDYELANGEAYREIRRPIIEGEHVFRNMQSANSKNEKTNYQFVYRKVRHLDELTEGYISSLNVLRDSGIVYKLSLLEKEGVVHLEDIMPVYNTYKGEITNITMKRNVALFLKKYKQPLHDLYNLEVAF